MNRDLGRLSEGEFDLLVIGGGIHGLCAGYDAALRGLSVALVERDDFGGASSFNHLRTVHGGLRSLQTASLGHAREAVRERRTFARIAPTCVRPLSFVLPTGGSLGRSPFVLRVAFLLDRVVGFDRSAGIPEALQLPPGEIVGREECRRLFGDVWDRRASGGARWHDYQMHRSERITIGFALGAARAGACLANYVEAREPLRIDGRIAGIRAHDRVSDQPFEVRARVTLNAAGARAGTLMNAFGIKRSMPLQKAINLVIDREPPLQALGASAPGGGTLFLVPWRGRTVAGTWHLPKAASMSDAEATRRDLLSTIDAINLAFPSLHVTVDQVRVVHRGLVPAIGELTGEVTMQRTSAVIDHRRDGSSGLISIVGVKYTTARAVAQRSVDLICQILGKAGAPCVSDSQPLPVDDIPAAEELEASPDLLDDAIERAIRGEMALTLSDVVLRRTALGATGFPGDRTLARCASVAQRLFGWGDVRVGREIDDVKRSYAPVTVR